MSHLIVSGLTKTVGDKTLFKNIEFTSYSGEKAGLIGINGTGKSTLLSIIAGNEPADSIEMDHPKDYRIAYLPQDPEYNADMTVLQTVFSGDSPLLKINREYEETLSSIGENETPELIERLMKLQSEMDRQGGWDINSLAKTALTKLGIDTYDKRMGELSGGQRKRTALAKILIEPADLLLLDEPTNHLDVTAIEWLQDQLSKTDSAVIFVTHDRYFLDAVSTHIYELADQTLYSHKGNYGDYIEAKAIREEMAASTQQKLQNRFRSELKWIRRGAKARTTKQKARIQRFDELSSQVVKGDDSTDLQMNLTTTRLGKKVIEGIALFKEFGEQPLIQDFSFLLQQGDRIGIVGPNGAGKSTLLKMIAGSIVPDSGEIVVGPTVKIAHFSQHLPPMDEKMRMIEYVRESSNDIVASDGTRHSAAQMLERFLFPLNVHGTPIGKLSGGERKRLYLLKLLMEQPNVLLLDEPTNDLDIQTLSVLEEFIEQFMGVVITISHDRFFLDRTAKKLWALDGKGNIDLWLGVYTDYLLEKSYEKTEKVEKVQKEQPKQERKKERKKLSFKEQKEWETIGDEISKVEETISSVEAEIDGAGTDFTLLQEKTEELSRLNERYEQLIERWAYLEELSGS
ncbi:ABC-F family ATP-binding cassette domain-containing protein [Chungangia koreensis]|uniref:ABC-F family ATP-binding cassette domain-containing protein n=1 Tax=Chungangia koreensis TaxID=752657 RepID=A0ABV8XAA4_9LACT